MRKHGWVLFALTLLLTLTFTATKSTQAQSELNLPVPCLGDSPNVYLIIDGQRHRIADWDTFLNLGYTQDQIVPCDADANDPLGDPITRLFKGSAPAVFWLKDGVRHHIPDEDTFAAMGFRDNQISWLPDEMVADWPLGAPLTSTAATPGDSIYDEYMVNSYPPYTIRLWHPGRGLTDFATISAPGREDVRIADVESIGSPPTDDETQDGYPEVEFLTRFPGSHCCTGTVIYNLTPSLAKVLDIHSMGDGPAGGRGDFIDVDGDGTDEFVLQVPLSGIACTQPSVTAILEFDANQQQYVGASPLFRSYYDDEIDQFTTQAKSGAPCDVYPLITTLLYLSEPKNAKAAFDQDYHADNAAALWAMLQNSVEQSEFYIPVTG